MRLSASNSKMKMADATPITPFLMTNQIGKRDRFNQMFSPKSNIRAQD